MWQRCSVRKKETIHTFGTIRAYVNTVDAQMEQNLISLLTLATRLL